MGKVTNSAHFLYVKIIFSAKSQQKNYFTENKVIGNTGKPCGFFFSMLQLNHVQLCFACILQAYTAFQI